MSHGILELQGSQDLLYSSDSKAPFGTALKSYNTNGCAEHSAGGLLGGLGTLSLNNHMWPIHMCRLTCRAGDWKMNVLFSKAFEIFTPGQKIAVSTSLMIW